MTKETKQEDIEEVIEMLEDLKSILFQDFKVWSGYEKKDFRKAINTLMEIER